MGAQSRGWGPGWPNCQRNKLVTLRAGERGLRLPVRAEVAPIFAALIRDLERSRGKAFRPDWSWGFACRAIAGTSRASNHSWGLAIDLDAPNNGFQRGVPGPGRNDMPSNASALASKYGCRWGGDYSRSADPMHYEFMGTPRDAEQIINRHNLRAGEINVEEITKKIQKALVDAGHDLGNYGPNNDGVDGDWGPATQSGLVEALQGSGTGSRGPRGPKGDKGDRGARGPQGAGADLDGLTIGIVKR